MEEKTLTSTGGCPVESNDYSLGYGARGALALADTYQLEKQQHFNRERVPERVVHAKGYGAKGVFKVTKDVSNLTCAKFLSEVGKETPVLARFSTVGGEQGSADTGRDPRGFSVKFYTEEGNWDMVGNNTPVFFIRDPIKFPDFIHTQKRDTESHLNVAWRRWDYWVNSPQSMHQVLILYSDRGTPVSARFMNGYGSHTMSLINDAGERVWVKWHFKTDQGARNLTAGESGRLSGENPDYSTQDLFHAIQEGDYPSWTVCLQVMTEEQADKEKFSPFDLTKVWSHDDYPLMEVGKMTLNENPTNYFAEIDQSAFAPSNIVPGLGLSPDKVLQGRLFSYHDAHLYRIGPNYHQVPVNKPLGGCPFAALFRDGNMRVDGNGGAGPDYTPSCFAVPRAKPSPAQTAAHGLAGCKDPPTREEIFPCDEDDYFLQPRLLYTKAMDDGQRERLAANLATSLGSGVPEKLQLGALSQLRAVHEDLGKAVAAALDLDLEKAPKFADLKAFLSDAKLTQPKVPAPEKPQTCEAA